MHDELLQKTVVNGIASSTSPHSRSGHSVQEFLVQEGITPGNLAYDMPSLKCQAFLLKHFGKQGMQRDTDAQR